MSIFPLPLVPFEHYMLADDSVEYPMTFFLRMQFTGRFDRDRAVRAVEAALRWHPLLAAQVQGDVHDRTSRLFWVDGHASPPPIVWQSVSEPVTFPDGARIDLTRECGLRFWFREGESTTEMLVQMHHACCDGLGAIQFLETFLENYGDLDHSEPTAAWEGRLALRQQIACGRHCTSWRDHFGRVVQGLKRLGRYFKTRPAPLAAPANVLPAISSGDNAFPAVESHFFDPATTDQIRAGAKRMDVSVNSLLMGELALALDEWNRSRSTDHASRPLRIVVPVNLRSGGRERQPAFNAVSLAFVDRQPSELANARQLVESIDREVGEAKALRRKMVLLAALRFLGRFRNGICGRLQTCSCLGSTVFSNLGLIFSGSRLLGADRLVHCDDLVLKRFEAAPPVRRNTLAGFAVSMYGNALTVSQCYDAHQLTPHDARALLDLYVRRLHACAHGSNASRVADAERMPV